MDKNVVRVVERILDLIPEGEKMNDGQPGWTDKRPRQNILKQKNIVAFMQLLSTLYK